MSAEHTSGDLAYIEEISVGSGHRLAPRSQLRSSATSLDLLGQWRFRLSPSAEEAVATGPDVHLESYDDSAWDVIELPAHWVLMGDGRYGRPIYTNVQFPFPTDPPRVPDENPTGDHRRRFEVPTDWLGTGRVILRLDGIESIAKVWLNGAEVGVVRGSRLRQELDVTEAVRAGENLILIRVHQWSAMSYIEDQDQWWLPGIFREVTLLHRPEGGIDDVWVQADRDPDSGVGTLHIEVRGPADTVRVRCTELGIDAPVPADGLTHTIEVGVVAPWSADVPRLYDLEVAAEAETVWLRTGFRRVEIKGDAWLVNGRRVRLRGVNRHDFDPDDGRVFDAEKTREAMLLMKRSNINAIRTSHYPPHPALLDLADELGFWVMDECDLETHGFENVGWLGNPSDDPDWLDVYLDRARRTLERDKNHPCVISWSLGNEAGVGANLAAMAAWFRRRDPGRPVHYEGDHEDIYGDVVSRMYASIEELERLARVRSKPIIQCEYVHAMGNGAGSIQDYEDVFDAHPAIHGGFVWEWRDHGLRTRTADGTEFFGYGGDFGEVVHDNSFVCDGMLLADGTPTPALAEFAAVVSPIRLRLHDSAVTVENLRHDGTTSDLTFRWVHEVDGRRVADGVLDVPPVAAGETSKAVALPQLRTDSLGEHWLTVSAELAEGSVWADAGHVVGWSQFALGTVAQAAVLVAGSPAVLDTDGIRVGEARFDRAGRLLAIGDLEITGGEVTLWRAPTENDARDTFGSYELASPQETAGFGVPGPPSADRWWTAGLNRLQHKVVSREADAHGLHIARRLAAADRAQYVHVDEHWQWINDALHLSVDVAPSSGWTVTWPRVGVHFTLPGGVQHAEWFGTGPGENYPDSRRAARAGRFSSDVDDLSVRYAVPQENGHRADLRELMLTGDGVEHLRVQGISGPTGLPGFTISRASAEELTTATHPHELPENDAVHLYLDMAQHGLGSRACGPDVLPRYALWPRPLSLRVVLSVG